MADQVTPVGGLAPGIPLALMALSAPRPTSEKPRPAKAATGPQGPDRAAGSAQLSDAVLGQLNKQLQQVATNLKLQVDQDTGRTVLKVVNQETGEVLLQMPPEEFLAMARNVRALEERMGSAGALVDKEG